MTAEDDAASNILNFYNSSRSASPDSLVAAEGFELIQAFMKIEVAADRQKVIELAKRLSTTSAKQGA